MTWVLIVIIVIAGNNSQSQIAISGFRDGPACEQAARAYLGNLRDASFDPNHLISAQATCVQQ